MNKISKFKNQDKHHYLMQELQINAFNEVSKIFTERITKILKYIKR